MPQNAMARALWFTGVSSNETLCLVDKRGEIIREHQSVLRRLGQLVEFSKLLLDNFALERGAVLFWGAALKRVPFVFIVTFLI